MRHEKDWPMQKMLFIPRNPEQMEDEDTGFPFHHELCFKIYSHPKKKEERNFKMRNTRRKGD